MKKPVLIVMTFVICCLALCGNSAIAQDNFGNPTQAIPNGSTHIDTPSLADGTVGSSYVQTLTATTSEAGTITWGFSGIFPPGLTISTVIGPKINLQGTPALAGTFTFSITARCGITSETKSYTIQISNGVPILTNKLNVHIVIVGGTAAAGDFNLTVKTENNTLFAGPASANRSFPLNVGSAYSVTETTTIASSNYAITIGPDCIGTMGSSPITCMITNTFTQSTPPVANLIPNPTLALDTLAPGLPDNWNMGNWGANTATFHYPVPACGGIGATISINNYVDGDAKWYPNPNKIPVVGSATYAFSDAYESDVGTSIVMQVTAADGTLSYDQIGGTQPATNGSCGTVNEAFTAPVNAAFITPFHLIADNGSLTITNVALTLTSGGSGGSTFPKGIVSMAYDDGWLQTFLNAVPIIEGAGLPATFYIISNPTQNSEQTIFPSANNPLEPWNVATTTSSAAWSGIYSDPTQHTFTFSDNFTATGQSIFAVSYTDAISNAVNSMQIGSLPAGTNANATFTFTLPTLAPGTPLAITQTLIDSSGTLSATNPLLTETIGYISPSQVLTLQAAGMEIGNHTMDHCMLETLLADPNSATIPRSQSGAACPANGPLPAPVTASEEIDGARTALLGIGAAPVDTFAYPYGSGAGNPAIEQLIADAGMISARSVTAGYNTPATDPFSLNSYLVDATITDSTTVKQWIDYASLNHVWLILTFHQIETDAATIASKGEIDGTTTAILQEIVNYLHDQQAAGNIIVDTVHDVMTHYINH